MQRIVLHIGRPINRGLRLSLVTLRVEAVRHLRTGPRALLLRRLGEEGLTPCAQSARMYASSAIHLFF